MTKFLTLNDHFDHALTRFELGRIAFGIEQVPVTFGELGTRVAGMAASLHAIGAGREDVIGYSLPNCAEAIALFLAISRIGARAVPLFPMMPEPTRAGIFKATGCSYVIALGPSAATLAQTAERMRSGFRVVDLASLGMATGDASVKTLELRPEHWLLAAASSGTTGAPKMVWITQHNAASVLSATADFAQLGSWRDTMDYSSMAAFPLSTSSILVVLGMILAGVRLVFPQNMSPVRFLELAEHWKVDALSAPPAYLESILNLPARAARTLPSVRGILTGMDFLHSSLVNRLAQCFPGLDRAASGYGLVETSTVCMTWKAHDKAQLATPPNTFTLCPSATNEIDVRDDQGNSLPCGHLGELWLRGPSVVSGYWGNGEEIAPAFVDGWFRTGDIVCRVDERTVQLNGRKKYLIKRGGKSISPIEVQDTIDVCPGVRSSAVVGVKHPLYGEMIWAFVVGDATQAITLKDIMSECRSRLPNYMVPDQVTFVNELPRGSGVGKLDRDSLVRMAEEELSRIQGESRG